MYNTKFILENHEEIYPGYLDKEQRKKLKEHYGNQRQYLYCGCRPEDKLYYRFSEDLKLYPEHNNYKHDKYCSRYKSPEGVVERQTAYLVDEENGEVTAYVTFNPRQFTQSESTEVEQENEVPEDEDAAQTEAVIEKEKQEKKETEKKEPKLSLDGLIRSINVDTYTEKILNGKSITKDSFSKAVYYRMQKVRISRMKKCIGELTLEKDGVRFIYLPFAGAIKKVNKGISKCYIQTLDSNGEIHNNFIFPDTLEKAVNKYKKMYGIQPDENTMIAGFQYLKKSHSNYSYRVLGRIHLFQVSDTGIYCRSVVEENIFNSLERITKEDSAIKFWIPPEDDSIGGIIQIGQEEKKILLLFQTKKDEPIFYDESQYIPLVCGKETILTKEYLRELISGKSEISDTIADTI